MQVSSIWLIFFVAKTTTATLALIYMNAAGNWSKMNSQSNSSIAAIEGSFTFFFWEYLSNRLEENVRIETTRTGSMLIRDYCQFEKLFKLEAEAQYRYPII